MADSVKLSQWKIVYGQPVYVDAYHIGFPDTKHEYSIWATSKDQAEDIFRMIMGMVRRYQLSDNPTAPYITDIIETHRLDIGYAQELDLNKTRRRRWISRRK